METKKMQKRQPHIKKQNVKTIKDHINQIVKPIFEKVLKETPKNRMSVGGGSDSRIDVSLYQPHNYRLYFDFSRTGFSAPNMVATDPQRSVVTTSYKYKTKNYGSEHFFENYKGCNITVKKNQVEVINKIEHKRWYIIKHLTANNYSVQIKNILQRKDAECIDVFKQFIEEFGGVSNFVILKRKTEDKIKLEDSIDKLGVKNHFHSYVAKKVYNESNIEFKDPVFAVNYFQNRAIESIAPEIVSEFQKLSELLYHKLDGLSALKGLVSSIDDLYKYKSIVIGLSDYDKMLLMDWVFDKFKTGGDLCQPA